MANLCVNMYMYSPIVDSIGRGRERGRERRGRRKGSLCRMTEKERLMQTQNTVCNEGDIPPCVYITLCTTH